MENNFIMLDGAKLELPPEHMEMLRKLRDEKGASSKFMRTFEGGEYFCISLFFNSCANTEQGSGVDRENFECGNYCTDEAIMKQHALHMQLNNLLWRFSMTHGGDKIGWASNDGNTIKYFITVNTTIPKYVINSDSYCRDIGKIYFRNIETAEAAIEEVVKPFIAAHPDFDWRKM